MGEFDLNALLDNVALNPDWFDIPDQPVQMIDHQASEQTKVDDEWSSQPDIRMFGIRQQTVLSKSVRKVPGAITELLKKNSLGSV